MLEALQNLISNYNTEPQQQSWRILHQPDVQTNEKEGPMLTCTAIAGLFSINGVKMWKNNNVITKWYGGNWISRGRRMKLDPYLKFHKNINSRSINHLNVMCEIWKLLKETIIEGWISIGKEFLSRNPMAQEITLKIQKWDL